MAGKPSKPMTPFDKSVTPSYLYKLKLFLSFLPPSTQRFLAVYIKFSEFRYTMDYFRGLPFHAFSFQSIGELAPYMDENERNMMDQMTSMLQIMEMMVMAQTDSTSGGSDSCGPAGSYEDNDVRRRYGNVPKLHGPVRPGTFLAWNLCHERRLFT